VSEGKPTKAEIAAFHCEVDAMEAALKSAPKAEHPAIIRRAMAAAREAANNNPAAVARVAALRLAIAEGRARAVMDKAERRAIARRELAEIDAMFEARQGVRLDEIAAEHGIARNDLKRLKPLVHADPQMIAIGKEWERTREVSKVLARTPLAIPIVEPGKPITWVTPDALQH
jgi:hypothetical protein